MANILLAEDDAVLRHFLSAALTKAGHCVTDCGNGQDALACLNKTSDYDLLLSDIVMPGIDGIELAQRAQRAIPAIKTMFITGFSAVSIDDNLADVEKNAKIVSKPFHLNDIIQKIETLLAQ